MHASSQPPTELADSSSAESALSQEEVGQARRLLTRVLYVGLGLALLGGVAGAWHGASRVGEASEIASTWQRVEVRVVDVRHRGTPRKPKTDVYIEYETEAGNTLQLTKTKSGRSEVAPGSTYEAFLSPTDRTDLRRVSAVEFEVNKGKGRLMRRGAIFGALALPGVSLLLVILGFLAFSRSSKP